MRARSRVVLALAYASRPPDEPGPVTRAYVRAKLDAATGMQMVLPVKLPAGYDYGVMYNYDSCDAQDDGAVPRDDEDLADPYGAQDETPQRADSRSVVFAPTGEQVKLPIVVMCVQPIYMKHELCPSTSVRWLHRDHDR